MKSRRILAAALAPVVAISATAAVVTAAGDEIDISPESPITFDWTPANVFSYYNASVVGALSEGDSIVIEFSNVDTDAKICFCKSDGWVRLPGNETATGHVQDPDSGDWNISIPVGTESYTYTLTAEDAPILNADQFGGLVIFGGGVTVDSVKIVKADSSGGPGTSTEGEEIDISPEAPITFDWTPANVFSYYNASVVGALSEGDSIVVGFSNVDADAKICFCKSDGWVRLPGNETSTGHVQDPDSGDWNISIPVGTESYTYTLSAEDATILNADQFGGLVIFGGGVTVDSVKIFKAGSGSGGPGEGGGTESGGESGAVTVPVMPSPDNTDNTPSGGDSSDQTSGDETNKPAKPEGDITADITGVDTQKGVEGAALNEKLLVKDGKKYTWSDVESVTFVSDKLFSVAFSTNEELAGTTWFTMGLDKVPTARADEGSQWATSWTIGADELALFDTTQDDNGYVKVIAKEDGTDINVAVTLRADADAPADSGNSSDDTNTSTPDSTDGSSNPGNSSNPSTGIAIAAAPLALAGVAAVVATRKKRK